ncbi:MAG: transglutaminase-like domain-containing protein [Halobacteriota archaeon]
MFYPTIEDGAHILRKPTFNTRKKRIRRVAAASDPYMKPVKLIAFALVVFAFLIPLQGSGDVLVCNGNLTSSVHYVKTRELTIPTGIQNLEVQLPTASNASLYAYSLKIESSNISYSKKPDAITATSEGVSAMWVNPPTKLRYSMDTNLTIDVNVDGLNSESRLPLKLPSNESVANYLSPSTFVQSNDREIANTAKAIVNNTTYESAAVTSIMLWVSDNLRYDLNATQHDALWTFHNKRGTCENYAHVSLALLRSVGIPARYVSGYLAGGTINLNGDILNSGYQWSPGPHAWIEVYYPDLGWAPYDPQKTLGFVDDHHVQEAVGKDSADMSNKLTYTSAVGDSRHIIINDSSDAIVVQDTSDLHVIHTSSASNQQVLSQEMAHGGTVNDHINALSGEGLLGNLAAPIIVVFAAVAGLSLIFARRRRG